MPIPIEKIIDRALASGFDAELKVAEILRQDKWNVRQGVYYIDKDENKGRELDIIAHKGFSVTDRKPEITCRIFLSIEVKRSSDPFIFFTNTPESFERGTGYGILNWHKRVNNRILRYDDIESVRPLKKPERLARSYTSFSNSKEQHIKSGIISAFKGAVHQSENTDETYSDVSHDICFFIPIVVVDGFMFECYFEEGASDLSANSTENLVYVQNYLSDSYGDIAARVNLSTIGAFSSLTSQFTVWGESMLNAMVRREHLYDG